MRNFALLLLAVPTVFGNVLAPRQATRCNADNCARAVTGTQAGLTRSSSRVLTDCSSFQKVTAYPSAVTTTITAGAAPPSTITASPAGTTIFPSVVPGYAESSCGGAASASSRFSSACSCASVTRSTSTAPVPTATVILPLRNPPTCDTPYNVNSGRPSGTVTCTGGAYCDCLERAGFPDAQGFCGDVATSCGTYPVCATDADCNADSFCSDRNNCNTPICVVYTQCANTASPNRLFHKRSGSTVYPTS